ncbi:MAG: hypothetical protein KAU48_00600 [Candidatus Thorarchaeota archaeon]|nr:hypothetical protein [Candidatus Thorarchaeota archaeon]
MELRSCAYNLADAGSYINDQIDISLFTEDMNYIKSLGFNAVKLWTDGSLGFWTTDYQLHQALSITDSLNLKVCLASIPEMAAEGWEDQYGNTPNKDELFYMAEMAKSHPSVIAHAIHLNDLAVASGAYGDDFRNNPNKILDDNFPNEGWSINPDCWVTDTNAEPTLAFQNSQYYEESLLGMKPGCIDYNYGWIYQDLGNINLNVYNTITIRIHSLDAGAKWALKVMVDTTLVELQADISKTGIYQYKISGFTGYHDIQIQLYAIDGDGGNNDYVYFDWITYGMDLININDDTGIDQYRDYYSDIAHGLKNRAPNQQVWFFSDRDPQWGWTPVTEQYWGEDLPVDAFGMQPYSEDRKSFDSNKVERYIRYFGMSGLPVYVDEWGVKDWEYKFVVIASFVICMENGNFPSVTHNEKIIGWTYFILDDVNDGTYGLRVNRISKGFESLFQDLLLYRPMGWSDQTTPAGHYYVADQKSINNIGLSHEMTTAGSGDSGYTFMWCTNRETFTVRADGTIGITGWFKGYDTLGSLKPGRSYVRVYILDTNGQIIGNYHDALNSGETYGSWYYKSFDFATGLAPGTEIRIGIGRTDDWSTDWGLSFGFSGIKVWAG